MQCVSTVYNKNHNKNIFIESQSYPCVYDVFKVHQSHHIQEQIRIVNWVRISQQPWSQDQHNLNWAHVPSACIFSWCQSVHMHRCSQCAGVCEGSTEQEGGKQIWLADSGVWCAALVTLASAMTPSEHGSESLIECEYISDQGKLECLVESCFGMNCSPQSGWLFRAQVKNKRTGDLNVHQTWFAGRRQSSICITFVISIEVVTQFWNWFIRSRFFVDHSTQCHPDRLRQLRAIN